MCNLSSGYQGLANRTLATNATHASGYVELDTHNMWGYMEERATNLALRQIHPGQRPFMISRSTFPSSGSWTGHWVRFLILSASELYNMLMTRFVPAR